MKIILGLHGLAGFYFLCLHVESLLAAEDYSWIITDVHYDPTYGTLYDSCNDIRQGDPGAARPLSPYGDYECDSPWSLIDSAVKSMYLIGSSPRFIFWTGDTPPHYRNKSLISEDHVLDLLRNMTQLIRDTFPNVPVYPCLGNHDYHPKSQLPPHTSNIYNVTATSIWKDWMGQEGEERDENIRTFSLGGYYTRLMPEIAADIRCVVINTNLYLAKNLQTNDLLDPAGQFDWLNRTLTQSRQRKERVHMLIHVPPGVMEGEDNTWFSEEFNERFFDLLSSYADIIIAVYGGHQHLDSFKVINNKAGQPGSILLLAPSVTPWRSRLPFGSLGQAHNPALRRIFFEHFSPGSLTDVEQFYVPLGVSRNFISTTTSALSEKKNLYQHPWLALYSYKRSYGVINVTGPTMAKLLNNFEIYGSSDFHEYYSHHTVNSRHESNKPCSCICKFLHICAMRHVTHNEYDACVEQAPCKASILIVPWSIWVVGICAMVFKRLSLDRYLNQ